MPSVSGKTEPTNSQANAPHQEFTPEELCFPPESEEYLRHYLPMLEETPPEMAYRPRLETKQPVKHKFTPPSPEVIAEIQKQVQTFSRESFTGAELECETLVALYNSTNGTGWFDSSNWLTGVPVESRHGVETTLGSVSAVGLNNNNLNGTFSPEIVNLMNLQRLSLRWNQLNSALPHDVGNLASLKTLCLTSNQLTCSIPNSLGNMTSLLQFDLSGNQFTGNIPPELGNLVNFEHLTVGGNQLSGNIPGTLGNLINLTSLYLSQNQLMGSIPTELGN